MDLQLPPWVEPFLNQLEATGLLYSSAAAAGTTVRRVRALRETCVEFDEAVTLAEERSHDMLEREARRRAVDGVTKGVYYQGEKVDEEVVYSDGLLTTLLKAKRPDEFAERKQLSGPGGAPLTVLVRTFGTSEPASRSVDAIDVPFTQLPAPDAQLADILDMV